MSSNQTITSSFEKRKHPLTINIEVERTVTEEIISDGRTTTEYNSGSVVKLDFDIIHYHQHPDNLFVNSYWENIGGTFMKIN